MKYLVSLTIVLVIFAVMGFLWLRPARQSPQTTAEVIAPTPFSTIEYVCNNKKVFRADFFETEAIASSGPDLPPNPTGRVELSLSDGRSINLKQTISASGLRYSNGDPQAENSETFIFWSKGNGAAVIDNGNEKNYFGCVAIAPFSENLPNLYHDGQNGYTIQYPNSWFVDHRYRYSFPNPNATNTMSVRFNIPETMATGTNLSSRDTGISVESIEGIVDCSAQTFTGETIVATTTTINGIEYSIATSTDAGAGNFYEETIYALPNSQPCTAIRYLIHSTNLANYEPVTIKEFDRSALLKIFDSMRDSLITR